MVANLSLRPNLFSIIGRMCSQNPATSPTSSSKKHEVSFVIPSRKVAEFNLSFPSSTVIHSGTLTPRARVDVFGIERSSHDAMVLPRWTRLTYPRTSHLTASSSPCRASSSFRTPCSIVSRTTSPSGNEAISIDLTPDVQTRRRAFPETGTTLGKGRDVSLTDRRYARSAFPALSVAPKLPRPGTVLDSWDSIFAIMAKATILQEGSSRRITFPQFDLNKTLAGLVGLNRSMTSDAVNVDASEAMYAPIQTLVYPVR